MGISIKSASEDDMPDMLELLYELGRPRPDKSDHETFRNILKGYITDSDKQILVAEENSKIIAMASMMFLARLNQKRPELYIPELIVTGNHQGRGVGKMLVDSCIKIGRQRNCHRVRLESGSQRKGSHEFYKKIGFEQSGLSFTRAL